MIDMEEEIKKEYLAYLVELIGKKEESFIEKSLSLDGKIGMYIKILENSKTQYAYFGTFKVHREAKIKSNTEPTIKDEVTWLRQTLSIQGIEIHDKILEVMIESYKLVKEKGNKTTFKDALEVTKEINRRNRTTVKYELK